MPKVEIVEIRDKPNCLKIQDHLIYAKNTNGSEKLSNIS